MFINLPIALIILYFFRFSYEEELLDKVILPNLQHCSTEADPIIRCASSKLLIDIAVNCHSKRFSDLFDILEKVDHKKNIN